jgi:hypothetical protein
MPLRELTRDDVFFTSDHAYLGNLDNGFRCDDSPDFWGCLILVWAQYKEFRSDQIGVACMWITIEDFIKTATYERMCGIAIQNLNNRLEEIQAKLPQLSLPERM